MLHPIEFQNYTVTHLYENEIDAFVALAPYWGLEFDKKNLTIYPSLLNKTVSIDNIENQHTLKQLRLLLQHTKLQYSDNCNTADLCIQIFSLKENQSSPISLQINNNKYHLKYINHLNHTNLQTLIHRNIWLPKRNRQFTVFLRNEQSEIIAYLIIQFFLKEKLTAISHIPFPIYEKLINQVLTAINPHFATIQYNICLSVWPNIPSSLSHNEHAPIEKINPFKKKETSIHPINPFKKNTQNTDKRI